MCSPGVFMIILLMGGTSPVNNADRPAIQSTQASNNQASTNHQEYLLANLDPPRQVDQSMAPTSLLGQWRLVSHEGVAHPIEMNNEHPVLMQLSISSISITGGCNAKSGQVSFEGQRLVIGSLRSTLMACQPARLMEVDDALSRVLIADPTIERQGKYLVLTSNQGERLHFVRQQ